MHCAPTPPGWTSNSPSWPIRTAAGITPVSASASAGSRDLPDGLTRREAEILALIARGMTNPEIARALVLSNHTVKSHINRIFAKTRSRDRAAATQYAQAHDLQ